MQPPLCSILNAAVSHAEVVYGDTDSLFVLVRGRSRRDAFRIGAEIAARVTASNPAPVALQLEKVYHPCILNAKKRCTCPPPTKPSLTLRRSPS